MAKHAALNATVPTVATPPDAAPTPLLQWSISEAWAWLGKAWLTLIHEPYLGLIALALLAVVVIRVLHKALR